MLLHMLTLYHNSTCPFYHRVLDTIQELGLEVEERDIGDSAVADELMARGGKLQVPYLFDSAQNVGMYESMDIIAYLREHYAQSPK